MVFGTDKPNTTDLFNNQERVFPPLSVVSNLLYLVTRK